MRETVEPPRLHPLFVLARRTNIKMNTVNIHDYLKESISPLCHNRTLNDNNWQFISFSQTRQIIVMINQCVLPYHGWHDTCLGSRMVRKGEE